MSRENAPGRPFGRSGAFVFAAFALLALAGCDTMGGSESIQLDSTEVSIDGAVHEVRVAGIGATDSIAPTALEASPGDAVRFIVADRRPHALTFRVDVLGPDVRAFLDRTNQLRGPPLVDEGAAWVVSLQDAPPGEYPFYCRSHDASGTLTVTTAD